MGTAVAPPPRVSALRRLWTSEEFLDWLEPGRHADLIDGEVFMHSPVHLRHARLTNFFERLLAAYIRRRRLGELHRETVAVRLSSRNTFLPDLGFFTAEQVARLGDTHAAFAPTFVAEVLSPASADRDLGPKFAAYEEHGVQEYWVLDPHEARHQFFRREGEFLVEFAMGEAVIRAASIPGFWIRRAWLDPDAHPDGDACLAEVLGASEAGLA